VKKSETPRRKTRDLAHFVLEVVKARVKSKKWWSGLGAGTLPVQPEDAGREKLREARPAIVG